MSEIREGGRTGFSGAAPEANEILQRGVSHSRQGPAGHMRAAA